MALLGSYETSAYCFAMTDSVDRLYDAVLAAKASDPVASRTARLLRAGRAKIAKKFAEEAVEVVIDAMHGDRNALVRESADLFYNLVVVWAASGVRPADVWKEMDRRERLFGIAEKLLKHHMSSKSKVAVLSDRRVRRRR
jgi:phosphoribosyl-ATP pyrophosphohydrolase